MCFYGKDASGKRQYLELPCDSFNEILEYLLTHIDLTWVKNSDGGDRLHFSIFPPLYGVVFFNTKLDLVARCDQCVSLRQYFQIKQ